MSWFMLDDRFFDNTKIAALSDRAKVAYLEAGTYCARELTDGFIPANKARMISGTTKALKELIPGLWEPCTGGYRVHDYLKYNKTRAQVLSEREAAKRRMSGLRSGERSGEHSANNWRSSEASYRPSTLLDSDHPNPNSGDPTDRPPSSSAAVGDDAERLLSLWSQRIAKLSRADEGEFREFARIVPRDWFEEAIDETDAKSESAPWPYCRATLVRCLDIGQSPKGRRQKRTQVVKGSARDQFLQRYREVS